jgi:hypothetical protein
VVDGEAAESCRTGRIAFDTPGEHTIQVTATDRAGNVSPISAVTRFNVDLSLEPAAAPGWGAGPPSHKGSSLYSAGLHVSAGALVDPDGRTWVADHNGGFCRVTEPDENGPGTIEHPSFPGGPGLRTCLGGLLPEAGLGPDAAGAPALFDPTPHKPGNGDEMALIPDGASPSSEVVRAKWNPDTGLFEYHDTVSMIGARIRPTAIAAGPDGAAYVIFQKSGTIQRIGSPTGDEPLVQVVGNTASGESSGIAATRDASGRTVVYVGEGTALTRFVPNAVTQPNAQTVNVGLAGATISALVADAGRGHLYIGTAEGTGPGVDSVHRMNTTTNAVELDWVTGYSMVGGLALRPDGVLFVLDDPALLDALEPLGTGRMFHVGLPAAHVTGAKQYVGVDEPAFTIATDDETRDGEPVEVQVQCRLTGGPANLDAGWVDCAADGTFQHAEKLADGDYRLTVRALENIENAPVVGLVEAHAFTVDTVAPGKPRITSPTNGAVVNSTPWFAFEGEEGATYQCAWDGTDTWTACEPGRTRTFLANGEHQLKIRAVDAAGNVSASSDTVRFTARGKIETVRIDSGPVGSSQDGTARFEFSSNAVDVAFSCRIDHAAFSACTSGKTYTLPDGTYTFEVRGRDTVGNISPATQREFTIDRKKPVLSANGFINGAITGPDVTFDIAMSEPATLSCTLDGVALEPCGSPVALTGLTEGVHTLTVVATDAAGNVSAQLVRRFTVQGGFVPPAPAPVEPAVTVIDQTGAALSIRIADIDRRVDLDKLREAGVTVEVIPAQGTKLIRFRIFKLSGNGRNRGGRAVAATAASKRTVVATIYRKVKPGRKTITLSQRELRKVGAGRYLLEVTPGTSRRSLGRAQTAQFRVAR